MDLKKHFKQLADLKRTLKEKQKKADEEKIAELQRLYTIYVPPIDRVCREFAKGVGWVYLGPDKKRITKSYFDTVCFRIEGRDPLCKFEITLELGSRRIFIGGEGLWGTGDSPWRWRYDSEFICNLNDFTTEKLVTALEILFKDLLKYLYGT